MYKQGIGFMTMLMASTMGNRVLIPLLLIVIGALLIIAGKEEE